MIVLLPSPLDEWTPHSSLFLFYFLYFLLILYTHCFWPGGLDNISASPFCTLLLWTLEVLSFVFDDFMSL
jgi:hypothetical protein